MTYISKKLIVATSAFGLMSGAAWADNVILDDLVVQGSACIGLDCVNGESFGFDTLRMKENNLRIRAQDTSASASFPTVDWQLTFNDTANGGLNKFAVDNIDLSSTPFTIESGSNTNALYVDDGGRVGFGTNAPVVNLHVKGGNSPTLRLEQDGSSGFTAQTWDVAGNEANFFVRDATNGSTLPLRIAPGADTNSISIAANNNVGMGLQTASAPLHIREADNLTASQPNFFIENTNATVANRRMIGVSNNGGAFIHMENRSTGSIWAIVNANTGTDFLINDPATSDVELRLSQAGDLTINGSLTTGSVTNYPDYVFEADYELMPLHEVEKFISANGHLPKIPSEADATANGINITQMQVALLEKVEELTLYTLQQQKMIDALQVQLVD